MPRPAKRREPEKRIAYKITEVARMLGCDRKTVYRWLKKGLLREVPIPGGQVQIYAGADIDIEGAERRRTEQRAKLDTEIERAERKLANEKFVAKARPEIVQAERDKLERLQAEREAL